MVVRFDPRNAVEAPIAQAPPLIFADVDLRLRELLDRADGLLGRRLSSKILELLKRAASIIAYESIQGRPITTVEALRVRIAPSTNQQPVPGGAPRPAIGHDTVRELLSDAVADVVDLAIRLGWFAGDFFTPAAITVFSTWVEAGRDSHALAVQNSMLPIIALGVGSSDSFVITEMLEFVENTQHDPKAPFYDPDSTAKVLKLWGFKHTEDMPLLNFDRMFELLIEQEARQRARFEQAASRDEFVRAFTPDIVVQRLPHGPYARRLRLPAGEILAKDRPAMAETLERNGYRGVLTYNEDLIDPENLDAELQRVSDLGSLQVRRVEDVELEDFQNERSITVDLWDVDHYVLVGDDDAGIRRRRVARHARFDRRVTVFETVGFNDDTMREAVVLAEYATANELRRSCIDATLNVRIKPGMLSPSDPENRAGIRRLGLLASAATVAMRRRAQAM